jgi:hypothetical protein
VTEEQKGKLYLDANEAFKSLGNLNPQATMTAIYLRTKSLVSLNEAKADFKKMLAEDAGIPEDNLYLEGIEAEDYHRIFVLWFKKWFGESSI